LFSKFSDRVGDEARTASEIRQRDLPNRIDVTRQRSAVPHWDFDNPAYALPLKTTDMQRRQFFENARSVYWIQA
jgi:hypothetical protein